MDFHVLEWGDRMADKLAARGGLEKLDGNSVNEDRSPFADVCASLIELMVFDRFLVGHPLGFERRNDLIVIVCDDRFAAERLADSDDAVIEAVHQHEVRVDFGQFIANAHGFGLSSVG